jgi:3-hydroxyphenylacetate 6-hydroxylase
MCAGFLLANRELYLIMMRLISCFKIEMDEDIDVHPVSGTADATKLVSQPRRYKARFVPRDEMALRAAFNDFVVTEAEA